MEVVRLGLRDLAERGYTILPDVLSFAEVAYGRRVLDELYACSDPQLDAPGIALRDGQAAGRESAGAQDPGRRFVTNLISKAPFFTPLMTRQPVLDLVRGLLGEDCILSSMNSLEPLPGYGAQQLHRDEGPVPPEGPVIANALWAFDDIDAGNGATRLIPGTHLTDESAGEDDPRLCFAKVKAGGVIVVNAHMLHAASRNEDGRRRRVVHVFFTKHGRETQTEWDRYVPVSVRRRLGSEQLAMLGLTTAQSAP